MKKYIIAFFIGFILSVFIDGVFLAFDIDFKQKKFDLGYKLGVKTREIFID